MSNDTKSWIAVLLSFTLGAVFFIGLALMAQALPHQPTNCEVGAGEFKLDIDENEWEPSDPGVEITFTFSDEGEPVDASVPAGWVIVCAKVPQPEKGAGISHLVIKEVSPSTPEDTTTTTQPSTTTSTTEKATQTTEASTTTTIQEASSSTTTVSSSTTTEPSSSPATLPFTGPENLLVLSLLGATSLGLGLRLIRREAQ